MRRTEGVGYILIVLRMLICVLDKETDGRTRGDSTENATQDLDLVFLVSWGRNSRLPGTPPVKF